MQTDLIFEAVDDYITNNDLDMDLIKVGSVGRMFTK